MAWNPFRNPGTRFGGGGDNGPNSSSSGSVGP